MLLNYLEKKNTMKALQPQTYWAGQEGPVTSKGCAGRLSSQSTRNSSAPHKI